MAKKNSTKQSNVAALNREVQRAAGRDTVRNHVSRAGSLGSRSGAGMLRSLANYYGPASGRRKHY